MLKKSTTTNIEVESGNMSARKTILLVDDDPVFRRFTSALLAQSGYQVVEAEHGLDGLQKLREAEPDLIVCDLCMPILNGLEFAEEVCWEYSEIPMIVVSATEEMSDVARALRFGIKDFLTKPISNPSHLIAAISNILEDDDLHSSSSRDFSCQWLRVGEKGELPEDDELHWHLTYLRENPNAAKNLLGAILPSRDTQQGKWKCSYNLLQSSELMPLVFDYAWVIDGQFAFYIVDSNVESDDGVATTLLVRAMFNEALRQNSVTIAGLSQFVSCIEQAVNCLDGAAPVRALFGVADMVEETVTILPAGLDAIWSNNSSKYHIHAGKELGYTCTENKIVDQLSISPLGKLNIANIGASFFSLEIGLKQ